MSERERFHENGDAGAGADGGGAPGGGNLEDARRSGEELLAAGDEAIRRALSGDSQAFLRANKQEGGQ